MTRHAHREVTNLLLERIRDCATSWYPELDPASVDVSLERRHGRASSSIVLIRVSDATSWRDVVAKLVGSSSSDGADPTQPPRPRVMQPIAEREQAQAWFDGMALSHRHFEALGDPRLGSIRPLEFFDDLHAVVMEDVPRPTLRQRIRARRPPDGDETTVEELSELAGMWLREYHAAGRNVEAPPRLPTRDDVLEAVERFGAYAAHATNHREYFAGVERMARMVVDEDVPERLPLELAHGDYAPRNVFVGPGPRVIGFDAAPRVRAPTHEELARFVVALRTGALAQFGTSWAAASRRGDRLEERFMAGYFGAASRPARAIQAFELLVLLNRLTAMLSRARSRSVQTRVRAGVRSRIFYRLFRREVGRIARVLEIEPPSG